MAHARPAYRPPHAPQSRRLPQRVYWFRRAVVLLALATIVVVGYLGITLGFALGNPSYGVSYAARAAEWGRQHGFGAVVTWAEDEYYSHHPPTVGGQPSASAFGSGPTSAVYPPGATYLPAPTRITSPAKDELAGEGVWHVFGRRTANGVPAMYEAFVRPDAVHTSYVVGVVWMDPLVLSARLYSGSQIPGGGPFAYSAPISARASENLVAAFNAGFLVQDDEGGYYTQGKTVVPLRDGAASVVIFKDGTMSVGQWGTNFTMSNQIDSVRQNLDLIVSDAKPVPGLTNPDAAKWGLVLGNSFYVWRSGLGETADGALIYVGGPSLSISDLANIMVRAGAEWAMELDINTDWVQFSGYSAPLNTMINGAYGTSLLASMPGTPSRYFESYWARDFFTMSLRSGETTPGSSSSTTTTSPSG